jgi:hypothetical protein
VFIQLTEETGVRRFPLLAHGNQGVYSELVADCPGGSWEAKKQMFAAYMAFEAELRKGPEVTFADPGVNFSLSGVYAGISLMHAVKLTGRSILLDLMLRAKPGGKPRTQLYKDICAVISSNHDSLFSYTYAYHIRWGKPVVSLSLT